MRWNPDTERQRIHPCRSGTRAPPPSSTLGPTCLFALISDPLSASRDPRSEASKPFEFIRRKPPRIQVEEDEIRIFPAPDRGEEVARADESAHDAHGDGDLSAPQHA